ncbi:VCBS repeat-containing protein [Dysgonomonas sp. Marseille-P4677]|uniref:FG-GAP-like repeat-containing protein n=1 Tax=Dysgonomonas sp. Marseille-P4677 TaxID=2364790 RepID=UPI0019144124|nr:FG-GAP-like repeat-containing protein [Dysgonomonas sp. Marseille-P4677]MBK5719610.1 VCBS repeat-containing protein [Dysgonomonas sp. Marseille-P4677]
MRILKIKKNLIAFSLSLVSFLGLNAQTGFPGFTDVTPNEIPQVFRGNFVWGDYNNDGLLDLVSLGRDQSWNQHGILMTNSASGFNNITDLQTLGLQVSGVYNTAFAWIDYNNDGNLDLIYMGTVGGFGSNDMFIHLYKNKGSNGSYKFELVNNTGLGAVYPGEEGQYAGVITVGDYNNDGYQDVLLTGEVDGERYVSLYKNNGGNGTFTRQTTLVDGEDFDKLSSGGTVFADFNNDGYLDILANGWYNGVNDAYSFMYINNGDGTFSKSNWSQSIAQSGHTQKGQTFVGDLNGDGFLDIITNGERNDGGSWTKNTDVFFYQSHSGTTINYEQKKGADVGIIPLVKGGGDMADLNSDGKMDFVLAGEGSVSGTYIYLNKGDKTFEGQSNKITTVRSGAVVSIADADNDGFPDITVMGGWPPSLKIWKNNKDFPQNTKPQAPANLKSKFSGGRYVFSWDVATDAETPSISLRYNLYIKKSNGELISVLPVDISTGKLKISDISGAINTTSYTINLPHDNYQWGVQTIDQGKLTSEFATSTTADDSNVAFSYNNWDVVYDKDTHTLEYLNKGKSILQGVYVEAKEDNRVLKSNSYNTPSLEEESITDDFGTGKKYTLTYDGQTEMPNIEQVFYFYDSKDYFLTEAFIKSENNISSNYIAPVVTNTRNSFLQQSSSNRILTIPFDNDGFVRYGAYALNIDSLSFEVTAIYNGEQRNGLVIGSVEHDTWKTGVRFSASDNRYIDKLSCFGGITHKLTRDIGTTKTEHGKIKGKSLKSPKVMIGYFEDWRKGLEQFGEANAIIAPPRKWEKGTPFGWNSWAGMETNVNYEGVTDISDFIKEQLKPKSFDSNTVFIGLDSWWDMNFNEQQLIDFVKHCEANGQEAGIYWTPFSDWGADGERSLDGTNGQYKYKDVYLYSNGAPIKIESRALDPTHPGTKMYMQYQINRFKTWGFKYIKLDFINNGTLEADSFYDSNVTTGVQAYNYGMKYLTELCGDDMFLALSIAPGFPAQYGNSRRISCDTWGQMSEHDSHTGYMLNSLSFGWWLDRVYSFNDADHLIFHDRDSRNLYSEGENRARITSGAITGLYMLGDNMSLKGTYKGSQAIRDRDLKIATNADINAIAKIGKSFYPVEGYKAEDYDKSENLFTYSDATYTYLVVFNFNSTGTLSGSVSLNRLGVAADLVKGIKELWTGESVSLDGSSISYSVPSKDARVYRIEKEVEVITVPKIVQQPISTEVFVGDDATFNIEATGGSLSYQWYKDKIKLANETSIYLNINDASSANAGQYYCIVSNTEGEVSSDTITLKVYTDEVKIKSITVNNVILDDISTVYAMCGTNDVSITIETEDNGSKIFYKGEEVSNNTILESIGRPGIQDIPFSIKSDIDPDMEKSYVIKIEKYFDFSQLVVIRWNNTMIANNNSSTNGGFKFSDYKWYKDGLLVGNKASYSAGPRRDMLLSEDSEYYLQVTTTDGKNLRTCASRVTLSKSEIKMYPNPVEANGTITIEIDADEDLIKNAKIEIFSLNGMPINSRNIEGKYNSVRMPAAPGSYIVRVVSSGLTDSSTIIVK